MPPSLLINNRTSQPPKKEEFEPIQRVRYPPESALYLFDSQCRQTAVKNKFFSNQQNSLTITIRPDDTNAHEQEFECEQ